MKCGIILVLKWLKYINKKDGIGLIQAGHVVGYI